MRQRAGFVLLGAGTAWGAGNVGPVAGEIAADVGLSLAAVGVLSGTLLFAGVIASKLFVASLADRMGAARAAQLSCGFAAAGNALFAISPAYLGLAGGRLLAGIGLGLSLVLGPVLARELGGVRLVGVFGGSVTLGVAAALGTASLLSELGADWRVGFAVAMLAGLSALPLIPIREAVGVTSGSTMAIFRRSFESVPAWRLELLFATALGVPFVLGAWLVPYLSSFGGLAAGAAGALGVTLYALTTLLRPEGARLEARGIATGELGGLAPLAAAAGLVMVAVSDSFVVAAAGVALMAVGFAIPYATMYDEAERLYPGAKVAAVGLFTAGGNLLPLIVIPLLGLAFDSGDGEAAFLALAVLPLLAGLANLKPAAP